ncbi:MAG: RNA-binding protein [Alphaproteobacteria bacterium]|jgi:RNase adaptor protein for sRNA GlmZ degradation|nr:RNA-binding protein [Alphaproteobacteria bacterium]
MPRGPKGQKRPADVIGNAVRVMQVATGEAEEEYDEDGKNKAAVALGKKGGKARASKLTAEQRREIAKRAATARWQKET